MQLFAEIFIELVILVLVIGIIYYLSRGAIYVPTHADKVKKMVELSGIKQGEKVVDLGSGDGRILMAFAEAGAVAHGYEINPVLVWYSRRNIKKAGLAKSAFVHWRSFWGVDLSPYDVVTVFGIDYIMNRLGRKLRTELKPGARVMSFAFSFPDWEQTQKESGIFKYEIL